jgi:hypothetical protein
MMAISLWETQVHQLKNAAPMENSLSAQAVHFMRGSRSRRPVQFKFEAEVSGASSAYYIVSVPSQSPPWSHQAPTGSSFTCSILSSWWLSQGTWVQGMTGIARMGSTKGLQPLAQAGSCSPRVWQPMLGARLRLPGTRCAEGAGAGGTRIPQGAPARGSGAAPPEAPKASATVRDHHG